MKSIIAEKMGLKYEPVALLLSNEKPEGARQFKPGKWGCVMFMLAAAVRGQTVAFDRQTYGCQGGGVGLGFGNQYEAFPGGVDGFCYFLSVGNQEWETGRQVAKQVKPYLSQNAYDEFVHGERYVETPDKVKRFINALPTRRRFCDMISFLDLYRLVNARVVSRGRYGKTREIMGSLPDRVVNRFIR